MKIFFLSFFFAKLDKIREIHGNQSVWLEVADIDNGMHEFTIKIITFHRSILPIYPSEHGSVFFFFTQSYSKYFENVSKIHFPIKSRE